MRQLSCEVVAAIETAVDINNGTLESAFIHSLAKIYKTSPQAIVYNMKRYNKVKAGCDDRQKTGRKPSLDKEKAADYIKGLLEEFKEKGGKMTNDEIAETVSKEFGRAVSGTWISRITRTFDIQKDFTPPAKEAIKIPKAPKVPKVPKAPKAGAPIYNLPRPQAPLQGGAVSTPQYSLPPPGEYPSFREDLQNAMTAGASAHHINERSIQTASAPPQTIQERPVLPPFAHPPPPPQFPSNFQAEPPHIANPNPARRVRRRRKAPKQPEPQPFTGFGVLKLSKPTDSFSIPPPVPIQPPLQPQIQVQPYPPPTTLNKDQTPPASTRSDTSPALDASMDWEVLKVVELP